MLRQLVVNLLHNAVTHGGPGNVIAVAPTRAPGQVEMTVADRGPGIPEESRQSVFEPFRRLDPSRSRPGSGPGLALVRAIAETHRGGVALRGKDPGLIVEVTLPSVAD